MRDTTLSLADITAIERACSLGAPTLGRAAEALLARWRWPLRDGETFIRLAFLAWYAEHEPPFLTGLETPLPSVDALVAERGREAALEPEARFTLALLWNVFPPLGADEDAYRARARRWAQQAAEAEPKSRLFREWRYAFGEVPTPDGSRRYLEEEARARYEGRGALGDYVLGHLLRSPGGAGKPESAAT